MKNKILVADDTKNIRMLLTTCLELRGCEVISTGNGKNALKIINEEKENLDLIFLDIRMPGMTGTEILRQIRSKNISCPVIIMTAFATVKNAIDCTKLGAVTYLQKPFSVKRVDALLKDLVKIKPELIEGVKDENYYIDKAENQMAKGNCTQALGSLKSALYINPYNGRIYGLIGECNQCEKNYKEAERFAAMAKLF